ncbi:hypothetical protein AUEXF2481DRAFT_42493 [Aureobasidium subglaciale EXF-2481]|uniref:Uncharacterized protein n=1 Tax=Aureobasidium subglaciale (strain EXF-2481) TaxID=1043005 RepID=A0A074Y9Z8_AURSE|nr:uncharacterized protein AUEXF2481DRAFT_42493 [Aureobasidium subglaciale EXF-2481]KEQ92809.1 hypothetical protein AUEXF2481DRAFT_42493 [Aureobasidium subglaciale EXF-2481]
MTGARVRRSTPTEPQAYRLFKGIWRHQPVLSTFSLITPSMGKGRSDARMLLTTICGDLIEIWGRQGE